MLLLSVLFSAACSEKSTKKDDKAKEDTAKVESTVKNEETKVDPLMKYEPAINMMVGQFVGNDKSFPEGEDAQNNVAYKLMEKHVGIKFTTQFTAPYGEPYMEKLKLAISSDDIPDVSFCSISELELMIKGDMIEDLTPYYEKYASENLKKILGYNDNVSFSACTKDGKIFALPSVVDASNGVPLMYIRQDWLDELKLDAPKTIEEVFDVARAFVSNDLGSNNKKSTIGISLSKELAIPYQAIMAAYGAYPGLNLKDSEGKFTYSSLDPKVKDVLKKLSELYKEGIFDREFAIKDGTKAAQTIAAGKVGIYFGEFWNPLWPLHDTIKNKTTANWVCYPVPGAAGTEFKPYTPLNVNGYYFVRKGYAHPEALIIALNHFVEGYFGGETPFINEWRDAVNSDKYKNASIHGWLPFFIDRPDKNLQYSKNLVKAVESNDPSILAMREEKDLYEKVKSDDLSNWPWGKIYLNSIPALDMYKERVYNGYLGAPTKSMTQKSAILVAKENEAFLSIITGTKPIEEFDKFVSEWMKLGGQQILDELNGK